MHVSVAAGVLTVIIPHAQHQEQPDHEAPLPTPRPPAAVGLVAHVRRPAVAAASGEERDAITLIAYESFPTEGTPLNEAIDAWSAETGIEVEIVVAGDAGTMVSKAVLTAGNPEGDVMYGVDNSFLSRVVSDEVFEPYEATGLDAVDPDHARARAERRGDPGGLRRRVRQLRHRVVRRAATSSRRPTSSRLPTPHTRTCSSSRTRRRRRRDWRSSWRPSPSSASPPRERAAGSTTGRRLVDNGVEVVDGWTEAYYERFSGMSDGPKPLVVSYGSSPPFEVLYSDPPVDEPSTGVLADTCFRQVEFAGVLRGTDSPDEAREFVDFLIAAGLPVAGGAEPLRVPCRTSRSSSTRCSPTSPSCRKPRTRSPPSSSPSTAKIGSRPGPTPSCAEPAPTVVCPGGRRGADRGARGVLRVAVRHVAGAGGRSEHGRRDAGRLDDVACRLVHALASGRVDGADGRSSGCSRRS